MLVCRSFSESKLDERQKGTWENSCQVNTGRSRKWRWSESRKLKDSNSRKWSRIDLEKLVERSLDYGTRTGYKNEKLGGLCKGHWEWRSTVSGDYVLCETRAASKLWLIYAETCIWYLVQCVNKFCYKQRASAILFLNYFSFSLWESSVSLARKLKKIQGKISRGLCSEKGICFKRLYLKTLQFGKHRWRKFTFGKN